MPGRLPRTSLRSRRLSIAGYVDVTEPKNAELDAWFAPAENDVGNLPRSSRVRRDTQRFQIHAGVRVSAWDRAALERLCAYVARPPLADDQLRRLDEERVELILRNPQRGPKTTVVLHPLQLIRWPGRSPTRASTAFVMGHRCPACDGLLRAVGAVLPPRAATWLDRRQIVRLEPTGPPQPSDQLELPFAC